MKYPYIYLYYPPLQDCLKLGKEQRRYLRKTYRKIAHAALVHEEGNPRSEFLEVYETVRRWQRTLSREQRARFQHFYAQTPDLLASQQWPAAYVDLDLRGTSLTEAVELIDLWYDEERRVKNRALIKGAVIFLVVAGLTAAGVWAYLKFGLPKSLNFKKLLK